MLRARKREVAAIDRGLEEARAGRGGGLVLRGEPGTGKSALRTAAAERAHGMAVLAAAGAEAETALAYATLQQFLRPVPRHRRPPGAAADGAGRRPGPAGGPGPRRGGRGRPGARRGVDPAPVGPRGRGPRAGSRALVERAERLAPADQVARLEARYLHGLIETRSGVPADGLAILLAAAVDAVTVAPRLAVRAQAMAGDGVR